MSIFVSGGYLTLLAGDSGENSGHLRSTLLQELCLTGQKISSYQDSAQADYRDVGIEAEGVCFALFLRRHQRHLPSREWVAGMLSSASPMEANGLLAELSQGGGNIGRLVCTCEEVGERQIENAIAAGACSVEALGAQLCCGTQCGSCIPEIKRLLLSNREVKVA